MLRLSLLILLAYSNTAIAQDIVVRDSCLSNITVYKFVSDSTYSVKSYYRNQLIFDGFLIHPNLNKQYNLSEEYSNLFASRPIETGRCTLWLNNGQLSSIKHYNQNDKSQENWIYINGRLSNHYLSKPKEAIYSYEEYDTLGKIVSAYVHEFNKTPRTKTTYQRINGKLNKIVLIENPSNGVYYPKNGKIYEYNSKGELYSRTEYFKNSIQIRSKTYFNHNNNTKSITVFDKDNNEILTENIDLKTGKTTYRRKDLYKKNASGFVYEHIETVGDDDVSDTFYWVNRSLKDSSIIIRGYLDYKIWFRNGQLNAIINSKDAEPYQTTIVRQIGTNLYIQGWNNKELQMTRHVKYPAFYSNLGFFPNTDKELENQLYELNYLLYDEHFRIESEGEIDPEEKHYLCNYADSFFKNGQLNGIKYYHDDTIKHYIFNGKTLEMVNNTHYLKAIKDLNQCALGMKNHAGEWVIPARYDAINTIKNGNSNLYFCESGTYTSVYNWDGLLLLPPTEYLVIPRPYEGAYTNLWHLSQTLCESLHLSNNTILMVKHEDTKTFKFINLHNELLLISKNRIYPQTEISNDTLDNMGFNIFDSLDRMGYFDLKGLNFPCRYKTISKLLNGDYIVQKDGSGEMQIVDSIQRPTNLPGFIKYLEPRYYDSLIILTWTDSTSSSYNIFTRQLVSERYNLSLDQDYDRDGYFKAHKNNRAGVVNRQLKTVIPFKYSHIFVSDYNYFICRNNDTTDFYDNSGYLKQRLICDSLYHNFNFNYSRIYYPYNDWKNNLSNKFVFQKDNQFGLINKLGKPLTNRLFDKISMTTVSNLYVFFSGNNIIIGKLDNDRDTIEFINYFPADGFTYFRNVNEYYDNGIIDYNGNIIIREISSEHSSITRFNNTSVFKDDKLVGLINSMGEWILKTNLYQNCEIRHEDGLAYVTNKDGKAGIIDCSGKELVKVENTMISYNSKYNLLWYTNIPMPQYIYNQESLHGFWRLKNAQRQILDTLDYPTEFVKGYSICMNKYKRYGVIDSNLNVPYGFIFTQYNTLLNDKSSCILIDSSGISWLMDAKFKCIKKFKADKVNLINQNTLMVFNGDLTYTMSIEGKVLDSTYNFFTEYSRKYLKDQWQDEDYAYNNEDYSDLGTMENDKMISIDTLSDAQQNFIKTADYYISAGNNNSYNNCSIFPYPQYQSNFYDLWEERYPLDLYTNYTISSLSIIPGYTLSRLKLQQLQQYSNLYFKHLSGPILTFSYNIGRDYNNDLLTNFYFSPNNTIYEFNLSDLIEDDKHAIFNQLVIKTIDKLELKDIPCYNSSDFIEIFNYKMQANKDYIMLLVDDDISIEIAYKDMQSIMRKEWKEKFLK